MDSKHYAIVIIVIKNMNYRYYYNHTKKRILTTPHLAGAKFFLPGNANKHTYEDILQLLENKGYLVKAITIYQPAKIIQNENNLRNINN